MDEEVDEGRGTLQLRPIARRLQPGERPEETKKEQIKNKEKKEERAMTTKERENKNFQPVG